MHITLFATNCLFTFPYSNSFYVFCGLTFQRRSSAKKPFMQCFQTEKRLMHCNPYVKTTRAFLSEHSLIFFNLAV